MAFTNSRIIGRHSQTVQPYSQAIGRDGQMTQPRSQVVGRYSQTVRPYSQTTGRYGQVTQPRSQVVGRYGQMVGRSEKHQDFHYLDTKK